MIDRLEPLGLEKQMITMAEAVNEKQFEVIKSQAHMIKGNTSWVGASRVHYAAYFIEKAWINEDFDEQIQRYQCLVESVIEFKRYIPTLQLELVGRIIKPENDNVWNKMVVGKDYTLKYCAEADFVYCLKND